MITNRDPHAVTAYRVRVITVIGALAGMLFSWRLWLSPRDVPTAPVLPFLPDPPSWIAWPLALALAGMLAAHLRREPSPKATRALAVVAVLLLALDQTRWQPWVVQYAALLTLLLWLPARRGGDDLPALDMARFVLAASYVWSGVQKMNMAFWTGGWPRLVGPLTQAHPEIDGPLRLLGLLVPVVEIALGVGLFTVRFRRATKWLVIAMHLLIIATLGPYGHAYNSAVWPWNEALILLVYFLFTTDRPIRLPKLAGPPKRFLAEKIVILLFGVMPALGYLGWWDAYLSASLYSSNVHIGRITLDRAAAARLPERSWRHTSPNGDAIELDLLSWHLDELGVPPNPEPRIYRAIARDLCATVGNEGLTLTVHGRSGILDARRATQRLTCDDL